MSAIVTKRLFTSVEYHRMGEAGVLTENDRVELIDGEVVAMSPIGSRHQAGVDRLTAMFTEVLANRAIVRVQGPVLLNEYSEPQPDLSLLAPRRDFYAERHPRPDDVILVVEVMDSSVDYDRRVKLGLYARSGVAEVWLVDLAAEAVELYREPEGGRYRTTRRTLRGDALTVARFPETSFLVDSILG